MNLLDLKFAIKACRKCKLARTRNNVVTWSGPMPCRILLIGEAPGKIEDEQGTPFVGPAGKLLDRLLLIIGLKRKDVCVVNTVCCRPPLNRTPDAEEIFACDEWFQKQVEFANPDVIVTLGRVALSKFKPTVVSIGAYRGKPFDWNYRLVYPTYHPAAALRDDSKRIMQVMCRDFKELKELLQEDKLMTILTRFTFERIANSYPDGSNLAKLSMWNKLEDNINKAENVKSLRLALQEYETKATMLFNAWKKRRDRK